MTNAEWRVLVADDEPAARLGVRQLLAAYPRFGVVGECRNGAEVLASLDRLNPDVVFLDVQMPGVDGFDVIRKRTPERMPAVVFLTAYDEFALRAFEAQALHYLVKPVSEERFATTMKRLTRQLESSTGREPAIVVPTTRGAVVVPLRDVDWIEAADNYARVWSGGRSYLLREPLRALEPRVRGDGFVRAHRRALVPIGKVTALQWMPHGELVAVLVNGVRVRVSRRQRPAFAAAVRSRSI